MGNKSKINKKMFRTGIEVLSGVFAVMAIFSAMPADAAVLTIGNFSVAQGTTVVAVLQASDVSGLGSAQVNLTYNSSVVRVASVVSGTGNAMSTAIGNIQNNSGYTLIAAMDIGKNGTVTIANITFTAVGALGSSSGINMTIEAFSNASGQIFPRQVQNGSFRIADITKPSVTNANINLATILNDNGRARVTGTNQTSINVTVTDSIGISSVKIDLSPIGGSANAAMAKLPGTDIYTITTNASAGINQTNNLVINATDTAGNFNNSVSLQLTVLRRGDLVRDNVINSDDAFAALLIGIGAPPPQGVTSDGAIRLLVGDSIATSTFRADGDGKINSDDAFYLLRAAQGMASSP